MTSQLSYRSSAATDPGLRKTTNEDNLWEYPQAQVRPETLERLGRLYAVADGVSGQVGGDVASRIAVDTLRMYYVLPHVEIPPEDRLRNVFLEAHRRIEDYARRHPEYHGMGTTLTCLILKEDRLFYGHVGDSRLYQIHAAARSIKQLTHDHTLVAKYVREGKLTPAEAAEEDSNVLEQAVGCVTNLQVELGSAASQVGDLFLLCSDGLTDLVSDARIRDMILSAPGLPEACHRLVAKANQQGGKDNITVLLVAVEEKTHEIKV